MFCVFCRERTFGLRGVAQRRKDQLIQGNLLKSMEMKTGRSEAVSLCYIFFTSLLSNTLFIKETKWFQIAVFFMHNAPDQLTIPLNKLL